MAIITREAHELRTARAAKAAKWMHDEMTRNSGALTQVQAWEGVRENFGPELALSNFTDSWLNRHVLSAFRKLTPDVIWEPAGKRWRAQRRSDAVNHGGRMLNQKPSARLHQPTGSRRSSKG
jgi:hypothetical protein